MAKTKFNKEVVLHETRSRFKKTSIGKKANLSMGNTKDLKERTIRLSKELTI